MFKGLGNDTIEKQSSVPYPCSAEHKLKDNKTNINPSSL